MNIKEMIKSKPLLYKHLKKIYISVKSLPFLIKASLLIAKIYCIHKFDPQKVFLIMTPQHGNLGDQAIAKSEKIMLKKYRVDHFEITGKYMHELMRRDKLGVLNGNPIMVHGGGYLGTIWLNEEILVRNMLKYNPNSQILFLPNTAFFEDDAKGKAEKIISKKIYIAHKHVKFYAREKYSYQILKEMGVSAGLSPDMVMFLKEDKAQTIRSGCLLLLRSDCEKTRPRETDSRIRSFISAYFGGNAVWGDTVVPREIPCVKREAELKEIFETVRSSELVITDRLHGMIFAAVTGTPCIVLNSKSHKVLGCYEWLKKLDYIRICEDPSRIGEVYDTLPKGNQIYDNRELLPHFSDLIRDIQKFSKK